MGDFCSQYSPFKESRNYDIDLFSIALELERGYSTSFLCEGYNKGVIYKDEEGLIYLVRFDDLKFYQVLLEHL